MWRVNSSGRQGLAMNPSAPAAIARSRASTEHVAGQHEDGDVLRARVGLELRDRVPAAQAGQRSIHQDDGRLQLLRHLEAAHRIRGTRYAQPVEFQVIRVHLARIVEILNEQHERRGNSHRP